jgi:hypothetical protein
MLLVQFSIHRLAFIVLAFFASISLSYAQTTFERTYGGASFDASNSVQQTTDGGYIVVGTTSSFGAGSDDVYLIKTNSTGDALWTRTYGGASYDRGYSVQQTIDGGYIVVGYTYSFGANVYLIKTNSSGDTLWTRTYGGGYPSLYRGFSVQQTTDSGYIVTGVYQTGRFGPTYVYLMKTNSSGDTLWTRTYGSKYYQKGMAVKQTADSGYIVTGSSSDDGCDYDVYLIKTNSTGDTLWTRTYGNGASVDRGYSVQQTTDEGYIVAGTTYLCGGYADLYLIKTNSSGDTLWTRIYEGGAGYSLQQTTDGGYIVTGVSNWASLYLIKLNLSGDTLWMKTYGQNPSYDFGSSVQQTTDGGYIVSGSSYMDVYLVKTLGDGTVSVSDDRNVMPITFALLQNFPNPFNPSTKIKYSVPRISHVQIKVFDVLGNEIETLVDEEKPAGAYELTWNAEGLPSGVYFYQLIAGSFVETKKMIFLK